MRFKLLRRRLTLSAPRMAVRIAMPWPLRWLGAAVVLGFCGAVALWAFEFGKQIAGVDGGSRQNVALLGQEVQQLRQERDRAQSLLNTSGSLITTERAAQQHLAQQVKLLEAENRRLRDDLGFFERLIPTASGDGIAIRSLQVEPVDGTQLKWQVLLIQPQKNAPDFEGRLELTLVGLRDGQAWSQPVFEGGQALQLRQYRRLEGVVPLPPNTVVKSLSAKVIQGQAVRAMQTVKL